MFGSAAFGSSASGKNGFHDIHRLAYIFTVSDAGVERLPLRGARRVLCATGIRFIQTVTGLPAPPPP